MDQDMPMCSIDSIDKRLERQLDAYQNCPVAELTTFLLLLEQVL